MIVKKLRTNYFINWVRFIITFPIILINSILFKIFDWDGLEWVLTILIYAVILWFFRIKYSENVEIGSEILNVIVRANIIGFRSYRVSHSAYGVIFRKKTRKNKITFHNNEKDISFVIHAYGKDGRTPFIEVFK